MIQHPRLLLVAAALCLPSIGPLTRFFFPPASHDSPGDGDWWSGLSADPGEWLAWLGFVFLLLPLLLPLIRFALLLACYGLLSSGLCWLLVLLFT